MTASKENHFDLERTFIQIICAFIDELELTHAEFGRRTFGESDGARLWRSIRNPHNKGKCRKVSLSEASKMASVLHQDFPSLVWKAAQASQEKHDNL